jgi:hypothetical protein
MPFLGSVHRFQIWMTDTREWEYMVQSLIMIIAMTFLVINMIYYCIFSYHDVTFTATTYL